MSDDPLTKLSSMVARIDPGYRMMDGTLVRQIYEMLNEPELAAAMEDGPRLVDATALRNMAQKLGSAILVNALQDDGERLIDGTVMKALATEAEMSSVAPTNVDVPNISGTAAVGATLTATTGNWTGEPDTYAYQWKSGATNVGGNSPAYVVAPGDAGASITCVVTATNIGGSTAAPPSNAIAIPAAATVAPTNTVPPAITGTPAVGQLLTCGTGTWAQSPTSFSYDWQSEGISIGVTTSTWTVTAGEAGNMIRCMVTATNAIGSSGPVASNTVTIT